MASRSSHKIQLGDLGGRARRVVRVVAEVCDRCGYLEEGGDVAKGEEIIPFGVHCGQSMRGIGRGELRKRVLEKTRVEAAAVRRAVRRELADSGAPALSLRSDNGQAVPE